MHGHAHAGVSLQVAGQPRVLQRFALQGLRQVRARLAGLVGLQANLRKAPWSATFLGAAQLVALTRHYDPEG